MLSSEIINSEQCKEQEMTVETPLFHEVVLMHAQTTPDALAVVDGSIRLSYGELDKLSAHLGLVLRNAGVSRGGVVAVHIDRSVEWIVAMLAVLRIGGVCMPLDPNAPPNRATRALRAAQPVLTLISARDLVAAPSDDARPVIRVDVSTPSPDPVPDLPELRLCMDDIAYAMHTSGSSGRAKIVLAQHRWLAEGARSGALVNGTTQADRGSWLGAAGAGIAVHEVCNLLWAGASIHVAPRDVIAAPPKLRDWLLENRITQAFVVTAVGEVLQGLAWPTDSPLRLVTLGGDRLNRWGPSDLPFDLAISYGSLEAFQIANTLYPREQKITPVTASDRDRAAPPPVGRPLPGVQVRLLEADLTPTPEGAIGEIWIDSESLCLGYFGDPALTADKFRPNPTGTPGGRIYRSGDAGRFRPNGVLEHHGRIDDVVKIRGHRVELGDVEWTLSNHPAVEQVGVVPVEEFEIRVLVACFTAGRGVPPGELRAHATASLPDYMVPTAYVQMNALPLSTNGKIDRSFLPPSDWRTWRPAHPYREPQSDLEVAIAGLSAELLNCEQVGADDHFMEMGGDSLSAARLQARIRDVLGHNIELVDLMSAGTPATLAGQIARRRVKSADPGSQSVRAALSAIRPRRS